MYRGWAGTLLSAVAALALAGGPVAQLFCRCGCLGSSVEPVQSSQSAGQDACCAQNESLGKDHHRRIEQTHDAFPIDAAISLAPSSTAPDSVCCCKKRSEVSAPLTIDAKLDSLQADGAVDSRTPFFAVVTNSCVWHLNSKPPPSKRPLFIQYARILT